jgi:hypothetical protein
MINAQMTRLPVDTVLLPVPHDTLVVPPVQYEPIGHTILTIKFQCIHDMFIPVCVDIGH